MFASPLYLAVPYHTAFEKCLFSFILVMYVLSMSFYSGWNSLDVMVVTANGYVTIVRSILLYVLYVSALVSLPLLIATVHCFICSCLK